MKTCLKYLLFALVLTGCAREGAPPGGPQDSRPPEAVEIYPEYGSVNVDTATVVSVVFDENVNRTTLTSAFSLSPPPLGSVKVKWKGKRATFLFDPPLLQDKTYVLSLGTSLTDVLGNQILNPINIAFSTGDKLDKGFLKGHLYADGSTSAWNIMGYMLKSSDDDSSSTGDPDPSTEVPDATSQVSADGGWSITNLKSGKWRIFAFKDLDGDRLWTPWSEQLAVPPYDLETKEDSTFTPRDINLLAFARPYSINILGVTARRKDRIDVKFDKILSINDGHYSISDVPESVLEEIDSDEYEIINNKQTKIFNSKFKPGDSTVVQISLDNNLLGDITGLRIQGLFGLEELQDTTMAVFLAQSADIDTLPPEIVYSSPEEGSRFHPGKAEYEIVFNEDLKELDSNAVRYTNSLEDTLFLKPSIRSNILKFKLDKDLPYCRFNIELFGQSIMDISGNSLQDSIVQYSYSFIPQDSLGSISGMIVSDESNCKYKFRLQSLNPKDINIETVILRKGPFEFKNVPAGKWTIESWQYRKNHEDWDVGNAVPFIPSDFYTVVKDTINVRARWESGGIEVIFP